jgi:2-polyprenyl-3-methyl-5-hydroxy-6-metoxy-1,4-benzoquinol methylase
VLAEISYGVLKRLKFIREEIWKRIHLRDGDIRITDIGGGSGVIANNTSSSVFRRER